jgi:hypothetical protein
MGYPTISVCVTVSSSLLLTATTAAAAIAGAGALAAYIDAKYHISQDIGQLLHLRQAEKWYLENGRLTG